MSIFRALAEEAHSAVPVVRKKSVSVEREGVAVVAGAKSPGTGYNEYAAVAVKTTRKLSRGFDKERYVVRIRLSDRCGSAEDMAAS
jgi:5-deoxy-D-glucuronate isomerase